MTSARSRKKERNPDSRRIHSTHSAGGKNTQRLTLLSIAPPRAIPSKSTRHALCGRVRCNASSHTTSAPARLARLSLEILPRTKLARGISAAKTRASRGTTSVAGPDEAALRKQRGKARRQQRYYVGRRPGHQRSGGRIGEQHHAKAHQDRKS